MSVLFNILNPFINSLNKSTNDLIHTSYFYFNSAFKPTLNNNNKYSLFLSCLGTYYLITKSTEYIPRLKLTIYKYIKSTGKIKKYIDDKKNEFKKGIKEDLNKNIINEHKYLKLPNDNMSTQDILTLIENYRIKERNIVDNNKVSGCIYHNNEELDNLIHNVFPLYYRTNPLHPDIYPLLRKMEAEIISMTAKLLNSNNPQAGSFTSGGTESILLACKTYRDIAYERGIKYPEIIVSKNAHAAYWKAGQYFNIKIVEVDSFFDDYQYIEYKNLIQKLNKLFTKNTIAIVASTPSFNHGINDPINVISNFVIDKKIYLHIDQCLGGFLLPFLENFNCDFRQPGVSSISIDIHKYGNGPKGGSIILYNNLDLYKKQAFVKEDWTGGIYGTSNLSGSRDGNSIALSWATLMYHGFKKYQHNALLIQYLTVKLYESLKEVDGIFIYGEPKVCIVAVGSKDFNIYLLSDKLVELGWNINILQNPSSFHFCVTSNHNYKIIDKLIKDIKSNVKHIMSNLDNYKQQEVKSIYGTTQKISDSEIVSDVVREYIVCLNEISN